MSIAEKLRGVFDHDHKCAEQRRLERFSKRASGLCQQQYAGDITAEELLAGMSKLMKREIQHAFRVDTANRKRGHERFSLA